MLRANVLRQSVMFQGETGAIERQLPHLLACAQFVEEHGPAIDFAFSVCRDIQVTQAAKALASLRKP